jgi:uncharacterized protein involved in propanediol utilization
VVVAVAEEAPVVEAVDLQAEDQKERKRKQKQALRQAHNEVSKEVP